MGDEGRRFLRYVMPGLLYGVETLLFLLILLPEPTLCVLSKIISKEALGASIGVFFASGAFGYIFASIHHFVHWLPCCLCFEKDIFNHENVIKILLDANLISPSGFDIEERIQQYKVEKPSVKKREIAQSISLALWYHFTKDKHLGKDQIDHLGNQAHGLGTARIATFFAILTSLLFLTACLTVHGAIISSSLGLTLLSIFVVLLLGSFIIVMFHKAYWRVAFFAHEAYTMILVNECAKKNLEPDVPSTSELM